MEKIECQSQSNRDFSFYDLSRLAFIPGEEYLAISVLEKYEHRDHFYYYFVSFCNWIHKDSFNTYAVQLAHKINLIFLF